MKSRFGFFDFIAPWYDGLLGRPDTDSLQALMPDGCKGLTLDVGGGTGRVAVALNGVRSVVVVDASLPMLRRARAKGLRIVCAAAEQLPFAEGVAAVALVVDALHHFAQPDLALMEARRVLRPGGCLLIEEPDVRNSWVKLIALAERLLRMRSRFRSPKDTVRIVTAAGLQVLKVQEAGAFFRVLAKKA